MADSLPIVFDSRAVEDIDAATQWYSEQQTELALEFLNTLDETFERIANYPQAYYEVESGIRRALMKKFPYCIYYIISSDRITILAILHARRAPDTWQQRLE